MNGGNGNDTLSGDRGNDGIFGGNGNDRIKGAESGNLGRGEIDVLTGGAGRDTFVLDNFYNDGNIIADGDALNFISTIQRNLNSVSFQATALLLI